MVRCPHCGDRGHREIDSALSVDVGPCPRCDKPVVLVGVQVMALKSDVMERGTKRQKYEHVMGVLTDYLSHCVIEFNE